MNRWLKSKLVWGGLILIVLIVFFAQKSPSPSVSNNIGQVTRGELIQRVTIAGSVTPNRKTIITAPYSGYIRKLYVNVGESVKAGDPVVSLAQSLKGSADDVYPLRAPFNGTVVQVLKTEGEYVDQQSSAGSGNAMVRIDDLTHIFIEANSPEGEVRKLKVGQEVVAKASAILDRSYHGKIVHLSLAAKEQKDWDKSRVEFPVQIEITDKDDQLEPGMSVIVDIITNKLTDVLTLKHEFLQKDGEQYYAVTEKGEKKPIEVGLQNEEVFEIKKGLSEKEKVRQTDFLSIAKDL